MVTSTCTVCDTPTLAAIITYMPSKGYPHELYYLARDHKHQLMFIIIPASYSLLSTVITKLLPSRLVDFTVLLHKMSVYYSAYLSKVATVL